MGECKTTWLYKYDEDGNDTFGLDHFDADFELQTVEIMEADINEQTDMLNKGEHPDGKVCPWDGVIVLREGVYEWCRKCKRYVGIVPVE